MNGHDNFSPSHLVFRMLLVGKSAWTPLWILHWHKDPSGYLSPLMISGIVSRQIHDLMLFLDDIEIVWCHFALQTLTMLFLHPSTHPHVILVVALILDSRFCSYHTNHWFKNTASSVQKIIGLNDTLMQAQVNPLLFVWSYKAQNNLKPVFWRFNSEIG